MSLSQLQNQLQECKLRLQRLSVENQKLMKEVQREEDQDEKIARLEMENEGLIGEVEQGKKVLALMVFSMEEVLGGFQLDFRELKVQKKQKKLKLEKEKSRVQQQVFQEQNKKRILIDMIQRQKQEHKKVLEKNKLEYQLKIFQTSRQLELLQQQEKNECLKASQQISSSLQELKVIYNKQNDILTGENQNLQKNILSLQQELQHYQTLFDVLQSSQISTPFSMIKHSSVNPFVVTERRSSDQQTQQKNIQNLQIQEEIQQASLVLKSEIFLLDKLNYKIQKQKQKQDQQVHEWELKQDQLKKDIKFLIGKIMKTKDKIRQEGCIGESLWRMGFLSNSKNRSLVRLSPEDLSVLSQSDSPYHPLPLQ